MNPKVLGVNINTLRYQVPGGMLSNLISQLKEQGKEDKYEEVLAEVPRVRKDLGEPPLVTPSSQIVGTQAVFNVLMGERYKMATGEFKDLLRGKYGQTVKPMNQEVIDKVIPGEQRFTSRSADAAGLTNEMDKLESEMKEWKQRMKTYYLTHYSRRLLPTSSSIVRHSRKRWIVTGRYQECSLSGLIY